MPLFKSREAETIETVRTKLEAARAELAAQEQYLAEIALEAALAEGGTPAATKAQATVAGLRSRIELLESAITEAERLESNRLARARSEAERSRFRALRQHDGAAVKGSKELCAALDNFVSAWCRIVDALGSREKLLTPTEARQYGTSEKTLRQLVLVQLAKVEWNVRRKTPLSPDFMTYGNMVPHGHGVAAMDDFSVALQARLDTVFKILTEGNAQ